MKRSFFQATVVSIQLYGCTTWTLTKRIEKRLDGNYARMLRAILKKSGRKYPTKQLLYGHLPPIHLNIICFWHILEIHDIQLISKDDMGCSSEDLPEAMDDREGWRPRVRDIRTDSVTSSRWWYIYICVCVREGGKVDKPKRWQQI